MKLLTSFPTSPSFLRSLTLLLLVALGRPTSTEAQPTPTKMSRAEVEKSYEARTAAWERYRDAGLSFIRQAGEFGRYLQGVTGEEAERPVVIERGFVLNPPIVNLLDIGASYLAGNDPENLDQLYQVVYPVLPKRFQDALPPPGRFTALPLERKKGVWERVIDIAIRIDSLPREVIPLGKGNPIAECSAEIGYEVAGTDSEVSERCDVGDYAPLGIMGNLSFPLQDNLTCIRDQGRRGTCVAHATAAAVETLRSVENGKLKNLSEQDIYFEGEAETGTIGGMFIDGLSTSLVLDHFDAVDFQLQLEREWNYNRASNRNRPAEALHPTNAVIYYPNSCTAGYTGEKCTDYASSGDHTFAFPGLPISSSRPSVPASGAEEIASASFLWIDPVLTWAITLPVLKLLLDADVPAVISMSITDDFSSSTAGRGVDANGYVLYTGSTTKDGDPPGGHAMEVVGFIPNASLPAGAPQATDDGFYIMKNSWGTGSGDCGFYYVDGGYVRNRATMIAVLTIK